MSGPEGGGPPGGYPSQLKLDGQSETVTITDRASGNLLGTGTFLYPGLVLVTTNAQGQQTFWLGFRSASNATPSPAPAPTPAT